MRKFNFILSLSLFLISTILLVFYIVFCIAYQFDNIFALIYWYYGPISIALTLIMVVSYTLISRNYGFSWFDILSYILYFLSAAEYFTVIGVTIGSFH